MYEEVENARYRAERAKELADEEMKRYWSEALKDAPEDELLAVKEMIVDILYSKRGAADDEDDEEL